jgi:ABC-type branched-subunit amino acid transport system permease subunit
VHFRVTALLHERSDQRIHILVRVAIFLVMSVVVERRIREMDAGRRLQSVEAEMEVRIAGANHQDCKYERPEQKLV